VAAGWDPAVEVSGSGQSAEADLSAADRRLERLRGASMGAAVMLVIQFGLGVGVNLYVTLPAAGRGGRSVGDAFSSGALLALHAAFGLLLVLTAVSLLVRAIAARHRPVIVTSAVGLLAIIAAAASGASFVNDSANGASLGMALATGVAMLCYLASLFILGRQRDRS
jgi:hypothetical protein